MSNPPQPAPAAAADDGLICGFAFSPGVPARPLASLAEADFGAAGFHWLHVSLANKAGESWLQSRSGLPESFFDALTQGSRSTRIERDGEWLLAVINDVTYDFGFDIGDVATLWVAVGPDRVVSARRHPLRSVDRLRVAVRGGAEMDSPVALLDHLLRDQADELQAIVRRAADRLDEIEDQLLAGQLEQHTTELGRLRRLMVRLQRLLAPEPSALQRTLSSPPRWIAAEDLAHLHRANDEFSLVLRDVVSLQERIKLMQDECATRVAEENNRSLFTLTVVTVLALPINLVSGLFGMNVGGIPLADRPGGFWWMLSFIGALTLAVAWIVRRRVRPRGR